MKWSPSIWLMVFLVSLFYVQILSVVVFNPEGLSVFAMFWHDFGDNNAENIFMDSKNVYRLNVSHEEQTDHDLTSYICYSIGINVEKSKKENEKTLYYCKSQAPYVLDVMYEKQEHIPVKVLQCICTINNSYEQYQPFYIRKRIHKDKLQYYYLRDFIKTPILKISVNGLYDVRTSQLFINKVPFKFVK